MSKDWRKLKYSVPIQEIAKDSEEFLIKGTAINETTTRNGVRYIAKELSKSAPSLRNRPILKDHNNSVDSIVGKTTENVHYKASEKRIAFEGIIKDPKMQEMINDGLITAVSVGAMVKELTEENGEDGECYLVAKGIEFVEISLVAVPADPNAGFEKEGFEYALTESFKLKEEISEPETIKDKKENQEGGNKMSEDNTEAQKVKLEEKARTLEEQNAQLNQKLQALEEEKMNSLRTEYSNLAKEKGVSVKEGYEKLSKEVLEAMIETIKSIKAVEKTDSTKGLVPPTHTENAKPDNFVMEKSNKGFSLYNENLGELNARYRRD